MRQSLATFRAEIQISSANSTDGVMFFQRAFTIRTHTMLLPFRGFHSALYLDRLSGAWASRFIILDSFVQGIGP
jgi:hypothetical protein